MTRTDLRRTIDYAFSHFREQYIVICDHAHKADAQRVLGRWAIDPELSFSWMDAAKMSQELREEQCQGK